MKKIITCVLLAITFSLSSPVSAQTVQDLTKKKDSIEQLIRTQKAVQKKADENKRASKTPEDNAKYGKEYNDAGTKINSLYRERDAVQAKIDAMGDQAEAQGANVPEGDQAQVENNDPTPPVVADSVAADSTAAEGEVVDATQEEADDSNAGGLPSGWWKYLLTMLGISALCSGIVYFVLNNKIAEMKNIIKGETQGSIGNINQRLDNLAAKTDRIENSVGSVRQDLRNRTANYGSVPPASQPVSHHAPSAQPVQPQRPTQFYLGIPSPDGTWKDVKTTGDSGQSLYQLNSADGVNGTFVVINKPVAVQYILMAVGKYLNPVCRVTNTGTQVSGIITDEPGTAVCENGVWRMTKKAIVHYV